MIGVQTKNTIRKELRFVVWWFTARTLPCNDIPEPKRRNISAKRELRLPFRMGTLSVSQRYRSNPPFRRDVTPGLFMGRERKMAARIVRVMVRKLLDAKIEQLP